MVKLTITFLLLSIFCNLMIAQENVTREKLNFNDNWSFLKADYPKYEDILNTTQIWESVRLPHDWSIKGEIDMNNPSGIGGGFFPCGTAWYKKTFEIDTTQKNKKIFIRFDGVYMNSKVWINGQYLGLQPYGYSTFQYDLSPYILFDKPNVIAVRVDNSLQPSSRWYTGSGIYRNVWLIAVNNTHLMEEETFVTYQNVSDNSSDIHLKYVARTDAYPETDFQWWRKKPEANKRVKKEIKVVSTLFDKSGNKIGEESTNHQLQDFSKTEVHQKITVNKPKLWSAANPYLYNLRVTLFLEGNLVDECALKIGIRSVGYNLENGLLINGGQEKLKGVCLHHDAGCLGAAVPSEIWRYRLNNLKKMGCNAIRPSHCPFAPEFYDLCDEMGFYVMDEAFDEWKYGNQWGKTEDNFGKVAYGYHKYFDQWAKTDLTNMILRDRNHPCVVMYSIGNEIPDQRKEDGVKTAEYLINICRSLDSTRLVTAGCDFIADANQTGFLDVLDIAGYNYIGRFTNKKCTNPKGRSILKDCFWEQKHFMILIIGSQFGIIPMLLANSYGRVTIIWVKPGNGPKKGGMQELLTLLNIKSQNIICEKLTGLRSLWCILELKIMKTRIKQTGILVMLHRTGIGNGKTVICRMFMCIQIVIMLSYIRIISWWNKKKLTATSIMFYLKFHINQES